MRTLLFVKARVKHVTADVKNVWMDVHVFDSVDELIHSETLTLHYLEPAGGNGDFHNSADNYDYAPPDGTWFVAMEKSDPAAGKDRPVTGKVTAESTAVTVLHP